MIPDEAVEAAAKALHARHCGGQEDGWWCTCSGPSAYDNDARAALEAAAPYMKGDHAD